jgi:hypothetical protein
LSAPLFGALSRDRCSPSRFLAASLREPSHAVDGREDDREGCGGVTPSKPIIVCCTLNCRLQLLQGCAFCETIPECSPRAIIGFTESQSAPPLEDTVQLGRGGRIVKADGEIVRALRLGSRPLRSAEL